MWAALPGGSPGQRKSEKERLLFPACLPSRHVVKFIYPARVLLPQPFSLTPEPSSCSLLKCTEDKGLSRLHDLRFLGRLGFCSVKADSIGLPSWSHVSQSNEFPFSGYSFCCFCFPREPWLTCRVIIDLFFHAKHEFLVEKLQSTRMQLL